MERLQGMAISGLGQAAGMGNDKALEPLLDPERFLLNPSQEGGVWREKHFRLVTGSQGFCDHS